MSTDTEQQKASFTSRLFYLLAIIQLLPLAAIPFYPGDLPHLASFVVPALLTGLLGLVLGAKSRRYQPRPVIKRQHEVVVVVSIWLYAFAIGALPFVLSGQLNLLEGIFESTSGWTTTGFTLLDVAETPPTFLLYRSLMQYTGGIGFVLLMLLFSSGKEAMKLFSAEGHPDILEPNLISSARLMMIIYGVFTVLGILLYCLFGMSLFDAVNHAMTAMGTGGFSTRPESIGHYQSPAIEGVTIVLMLLGSTNFAILALAGKGKWREVRRIGELRFAGILLFLAIAACTLLGFPGLYHTFSESFRSGLFHMVSALTTTGFSLGPLDHWYPAMHLVTIVIMLIGGGAGSTAGGIKYSRVYILYKSFTDQLAARFRPELAVNEPYIYKSSGKTYLSPASQLTVHHFTLVYLAAFLLGVLALTLTGVSLSDAMFEFASSLGTIGLSLGLSGPGASDAFLVVQIIGMILARLEVYIVFIFLAAGVDRIRKFRYNRR